MEIKDNVMVPLGYGKYVRSDKIISLEPIEDNRGPGRRTIVHVEEVKSPIIASRTENSILAKCIEYIQNNISRKLSVSDIAKSIPISQSYLSTIFKKHMDMTLVDYMNNYRLEKSKEMIRKGEYNITQIADFLGYASVHYFSTQFKLKYGISPRSYAKSVKR